MAEDKDKAKNKTEDKVKTKTKTEDKDENIDRGRNEFIQKFHRAMKSRDKKGNWKRGRIVWVFWNDGHVSELCEKWIYHNGNYAYTRFEELRTYSGEVLFTRENKATVSKYKSETYIDIDQLKIFKVFTVNDMATPKTKTKTKTMIKDKNKTKTEDKNKTKTEDKNKTTTKTKTENKDLLDMINKRIDTINKWNKLLAKLKAEVAKKIELIYESMCELQDEIYSDDSWLRLVELNKIDAIIDEALNAVWIKFHGKNRINPEMIKIDKHKDIDGYVSKLTDVINNKIELVNRMCESIDHVISEIKNETNMIDEKIHKVSEMDNDTLHLIDDKLNEIITQSRKKLRKIAV